MDGAGHHGGVLDAAIDGKFVLLTSPDLLDEVRHVLSYPRLRTLPQTRVQEVLALLPIVAHMVDPEERLSVIRRDPADNRVLECAVAGKASHIVSGDDHLLGLKSFRGIRVMTPAFFFQLLKKQG